MSEENTTPEQPEAKKEPEILVVKLTRQRKIIHLETEDGSMRPHTLIEMTGAERDQFFGAMAERTRVDAKGKPQGLKDFKDIQAALIAKCIRDENNHPVPIQKIAAWPATAQKTVFEICQDMNGLAIKEDEDEGKS